MILTIEELEWVKERMKIYVIKYQEIYDEVLDHILTGIEERRTAGDSREISVVFQDVVEEHFNGYIGIEALALSEEKIYQKNISSLFYQRLKQSFNWQVLLTSVILLALAYKMPNVKLVHDAFVVMMFVLGFGPNVYALIKLTGKVKILEGKRSLLVTFLRSQMMVPLVIFYCFIYAVPNLFVEGNNHKHFYTFSRYHPVIMMAGLIFFMLVSVSYLQSFREIVAKKIKSY